jgi:hypothetical protein
VLLAAALIIQSVTVPGSQLHVKLATQAGDPYDARTIEKDVRYLWSLGRFDDVRVEEPAPGELIFRVTPRQRLVLRDVRLLPHSFGIDLKLPPGTPIDRVSARAIARGVERQLDARVEERLVPRGRDTADLELRVVMDRKKRAEASGEIRYEVSKDFCRTLFLERRDAQQAGALEFTAEFDLERGLTIARGQPYRVGRIEFAGNRHYSDALVRRYMLLDEGAVFDEGLLRRSVARLNRSGMFDPVGERSVFIERNAASGVADVTLRLTERKRGAWNIAGPWPLQGSVSARLPKWASYAASVSVYSSPLRILSLPRRLTPVFAIQRPYTPAEGWRSGFAIAPQLGLRGAAIGYAVGQLQQRLVARISGERSAEAPLAVTGEIDAACLDRPRLRILRTGATMALGFLGTLM